ncbi:MAG TPA: HK97-gp10 family putative phage morphogenesis protein [Phycisphaerae bacterium]|nr:HK97-gp10 family putative phage morphogenesis protein [Phycisphaerae bacterium]
MAATAITLIGDVELRRKFDSLAPKLQRKALRRAITKAARVTVKAAKAEAPSETKTLQKALGYRVFTFPKAAPTGVGAVIGVKKDARGKVQRFRRGVLRGKRGMRIAKKGETAAAYRNPEKYLHLIVLGTKHSKANNFLLRAAQRSRGDSIRIIAEDVRVQLQSESPTK